MDTRRFRYRNMTRSFTILRLRLLSPFHLGKGRENEFGSSGRWIASDTLHAALTAMAVRLYGAGSVDADFLASWKVSSAFPYRQQEDGSTQWFFPRPMSRMSLMLNGNTAIPEVHHKTLKRIQWLEKAQFEDCLAGNPISFDRQVEDPGTGQPRSVGASLMETDLFLAEMQHRVAVPHPGSGLDTTPFFFERLHPFQGVGLFALLICDQAAVLDRLRGCAALLGEEGIGADRHLGNGRFEPIWGELELDLPAKPTHQVLLSKYCPKKQEVGNILTDAAYSVERRGGFISSSPNPDHTRLRKRSISMFSEGSVFSGSAVLEGKMVDLRPMAPPGGASFPHPIWRDGRPVTLPMIISQNVLL